MSTSARMMVVLPTPGPPVIMENLLARQRSSAVACWFASEKPALFSHHSTAFDASTGRNASGVERMRLTCCAVCRSAQ